MADWTFWLIGGERRKVETAGRERTHGQHQELLGKQRGYKAVLTIHTIHHTRSPLTTPILAKNHCTYSGLSQPLWWPHSTTNNAYIVAPTPRQSSYSQTCSPNGSSQLWWNWNWWSTSGHAHLNVTCYLQFLYQMKDM